MPTLLPKDEGTDGGNIARARDATENSGDTSNVVEDDRTVGDAEAHPRMIVVDGMDCHNLPAASPLVV